MTLNKINSSGVVGFQIIDEQGEYFLTETTEELAIAKYNEIKTIANMPPIEQPSIQDLAQAVAELSAIVLGGL